MLNPIILENRKSKDIELLTQMGFTQNASEFQLTIYDITNPKKPIIVAATSREKNVLQRATHTIPVKRKMMLKLELCEFLPDDKTCITTKRVLT